jgi:hypothetical protein
MSPNTLLLLVSVAITKAWEECGDVPFPLYERESQALAQAAIDAVRAADQLVANVHVAPASRITG